MKQRLVVMNGQRIVQTTPAGSDSFAAASNEVAGKAGTLKPGLYPLYSASAPDKKQTHSGQVIHTDKQSVFQKCGSNIVKHNRQDFDIVPEIGAAVAISYADTGRAAVQATSLQQGRGMKR